MPPRPPPAEDDQTPRAREEFGDLLAAGTGPSTRTLKGRYGIGQGRAQRIQNAITTAVTRHVELAAISLRGGMGPTAEDVARHLNGGAYQWVLNAALIVTKAS
ncbi:hypothetical protein ACH5AL_20435 [Actinacidiphila glaucinigra]|uniref:hypothetical protein n=1 Tax=Actinacidiphila glaucinigra TaxID=235986 RepID=UPI0029A69DD0|nr:hypothetical protein [Streptomyces sp. PA03-3a]